MARKKVSSGKLAHRKMILNKSIDFYRQFPDRFIEEVCEISLNLYQKVLVRAFFRKKYSMWILSRGLGKSWLGALALMVYCILYKNTLAGIIAPSFRQSKMVIEDKIIKDLLDRSPFLKGEVKKMALNMAEAKIEFYNGSRIIAVPMGDGNKIRGYRFHVVLADEYAQIPKAIIDLVVNPMMNVKRGYEVGKVDYDDDVGNRLLITSSSYYRHNHLYSEFKNFLNFVAEGNEKYFVATLPYQVGVKVGLFDEDHIEKEKRRLTSMDFRMEYECIFPNMSENAWVEPKDLEICSSLKHIETAGEKGYEYIAGLDVARVEGGDNTICHIFKLVWRKNYLEIHLVYTLSMNGEKFETQASNIRQLLKRFGNVIRMFMDTQTIGQGLADELAKEYWDFEDLKSYPPIIDANDEQAVANIKNGIQLIYGVTPTSENNHKMGMAIKKYTQKHYVKMYSLDAGDDKVEKDEILTEDEERQIYEAEATRREILNIESKPNGMYYKFEPVSKRKEDDGGRKDRWSAFGLGCLGAEIIQAEMLKEDDVVCVGRVDRR